MEVKKMHTGFSKKETNKPSSEHDCLEKKNGVRGSSKNRTNNSKRVYKKPIIRDIDLSFLSLEL